MGFNEPTRVIFKVSVVVDLLSKQRFPWRAVSIVCRARYVDNDNDNFANCVFNATWLYQEKKYCGKNNSNGVSVQCQL